MNQHDILMIAVADVSKGLTDMSYKGVLQILTKLSMGRQVCPGILQFRKNKLHGHV